MARAKEITPPTAVVRNELLFYSFAYLLFKADMQLILLRSVIILCSYCRVDQFVSFHLRNFLYCFYGGHVMPLYPSKDSPQYRAISAGNTHREVTHIHQFLKYICMRFFTYSFFPLKAPTWSFNSYIKLVSNEKLISEI